MKDEEIKKIPEPTVRRLIQIESVARREMARGITMISSSKLGKELGAPAHTIRKDINYIGGAGEASAGYDLARLAEKINRELALSTKTKICIVGLGRLGSALLNFFSTLHSEDVEIAAAFDANINTLETLKTEAPLFPSYEMAETIRMKKIEVAILALPPSETKEVVDKLIHSGIRAILNYTGVALPQELNGVIIRNLDVNGELRFIKALLNKKDIIN